MTRKIVIAGGSGFIGRGLEAHFSSKGDNVTVLTRTPSKPNQVGWDGKTQGAWVGSLEGATALINLTGKNINCRWNDENKREIIASRTEAIAVLGAALRTLQKAPKVWIQSAGIDFVGDGPVGRDESAPRAPSGFLTEICALWEQAFAAQSDLPIRRALFRIGPVLGQGGGPLVPLATLAKLFLGGSVGAGTQHFSWIHLGDLAGIFDWAIDNQNASGTYHAVAPNPATNAQFMFALRRAYGRPWSPPVPSFAARIGAEVIGSPADIVLGGSYGVPKRLLAEGYKFRFPTADSALADLIPQR